MADLLLLDDDPRIVELLAKFLEKRGHVVRTATSFAAAHDRILERKPDLLLSDLDLGVESGREELPRMSRAGILPPTLVVSGYLDRDLAAELEALPGVVGLLVKPFDMPKLEARIQACLSKATA